MCGVANVDYQPAAAPREGKKITGRIFPHAHVFSCSRNATYVYACMSVVSTRQRPSDSTKRLSGKRMEWEKKKSRKNRRIPLLTILKYFEFYGINNMCAGVRMCARIHGYAWMCVFVLSSFSQSFLLSFVLSLPSTLHRTSHSLYGFAFRLLQSNFFFFFFIVRCIRHLLLVLWPPCTYRV